MGWTVYYKGTADSAITDEERQILDRHVAAWSPKLDDGSDAYAWDVKEEGKLLKGSTQVQFSADAQADFVTVVRATQELETLLPRFQFVVNDDYVVTKPTLPSAVKPE